jgi:voltage-gated potassium channel
MFQPLRAMLREPETRVLVLAALTTIAIGTVTYVLIEQWTVLDALYFCVVTLATVGFGDLHPTTDLGKLFTIGYIILGVGIIAGFIKQLASQRQAHPRLGRVIHEVEDEVERVV